MTKATIAAFAVDRLRRRSPGERAIVYLDQCIQSSLARDAAAKPLLETLRRGVRSGRIVCPVSQHHFDETVLTPGSYEAITEIVDELSLGVKFHHDEDYLLFMEVFAAAETFLGKPASDPAWREAFDKDPQTPLDDLFTGGFRVAVRFGQVQWMQDEVTYQKDGSAGLARCFEVVQKEGRTFADQAEREYDAIVKWKLAWLVDPAGVEARMAQATLPILAQHLGGGDLLAPGGATSRYLGLAKRRPHVESLLRRHPEIGERRAEFIASDALRAVPSLRYPAMLMAGLEVTPGRKPRASDHHDIQHLTLGLSRCDVATGDSGMVAMCRERRLVPAGCSLFSSRELDALQAHIERLLT